MQNGRIRRYFRHGTLTQMRVFEAVARLGNFTRAGEEVHMAQSTVSLHVKKLSETVGAPLLEQTGKRIRLTSAGEEVYATCKRVFESFTDLEATLTDIRALKAGRLRIATTTAGEYLMPQLLAHFMRQHSGIEVSLHVAARSSILGRLDASADDLYLLTSPPHAPAIIAHAILPNPLVALAPADHPLVGTRNVSFARFAREPLLMREVGSGTRLAAEHVFSAHGIEPTIRMELGSNESIKEAVSAGLGVSLVYRAALAVNFDPARFAILDVAGLASDASWELVHPAGTKLSSIAQTFVAFARTQAQRIFAEHAANRTVARVRDAGRTSDVPGDCDGARQGAKDRLALHELPNELPYGNDPDHDAGKRVRAAPRG
jgi:DNA-binding transcriptional LysR family regulator